MDTSAQEEITNANSWAQEELGKADFGDKRRDVAIYPHNE
jgi:hypothetical protein